MSQIELTGEGASRAIRLIFDANEAHILRSVAEQLRGLVTNWADDRAAQRLFPIGYDDAEAQAEFSRFTRAGLAERKVAAASGVVAALSHPDRDGDGTQAGGANAVHLREPGAEAEFVVDIPLDEAWPWLTFFTDVRLVLAERLAADPAAEEAPLQHGIYEWTASLQAAIVDAVSAEQASPQK